MKQGWYPTPTDILYSGPLIPNSATVLQTELHRD